MLLPVDVGTAFENVLAVGKGSASVTENEFLRGHDQLAVRSRYTRVGDDWQRFDLRRDLLRSFTSRLLAHRENYRDRLPLKMDLAVRQQRLIRHDPADLVFADQVFRRDDTNHAFALRGF